MLPQVPPGGSSRRAAVSDGCFHTAEPAGGAGRIEPAERYMASPHIGISAAERQDISRI